MKKLSLPLGVGFGNFMIQKLPIVGFIHCRSCLESALQSAWNKATSKGLNELIYYKTIDVP